MQVARPYWPLLAAGVGASAAEMGAQLAIPLILRYLIDDVLGRRQEDGLLLAVVLLVATALVSLVARTGSRFALAKLAAHVAIDLRDLLARHLRRLSSREASRRRGGEIMSLFTNDAQVVADFFESVAGAAIVNVLRLVVTLGVLVYLFQGLALLALLLLPAYALLPVLFGRRLKRAGDDLQEQQAELSGDLQVSIAATREIKALGRESWDAARLHASFARLLGPYLRLTLFEVLAGAAFVLFWVSAAIIYWVGGTRVLAGTMTVGELLAAISYFTYLDIPISGFVGFNARWQPVLASSERLVRFLATPAETPDRPGAQPLSGVRGEIVFDRVDFGYGLGSPVLSGLRFEVAAGERVAIVGPSGAGKTSLVNLLLRLDEPSAGRVLVDGHDVRELTASSLRAAVGAVFQDSYLFPGTIEENVRFGDVDATEERVIAACRAAGADGFIHALAAGYRTPLGERGITLSAGQRQRLAIARALLRDPRILVLDEATSALDSAAELEVLRAVGHALAGRTILLIAHRLSTVLWADRIVVIGHGAVLAAGTHEQLVAECDFYRELYGAQLAL